jgi:hypothetical protein
LIFCSSLLLHVNDVSGEDLLEVMMVESIDERVDGRVGITYPEDIEIELRGSGEFLEKDKHKKQMKIVNEYKGKFTLGDQIHFE